MSDSTRIRAATPDDCDRILDFICELARYEHAEDEVVATAADIHQRLFADRATVTALNADVLHHYHITNLPSSFFLTLWPTNLDLTPTVLAIICGALLAESDTPAT